MTIEKQDWNKNQKKVYDWLVEWGYGDKSAIATIVGGGSYEYGAGIEEVDRDRYETDMDYKEYIDSQSYNWCDDAGLPGSGWWLVGSMY